MNFFFLFTFVQPLLLNVYAPISMKNCLLKWFCFHGDIIANSIAAQQFKVILPISQSKHLFGVIIKEKLIHCQKLAYVFEENNLNSYVKNCDHISDTFYRVTLKS